MEKFYCVRVTILALGGRERPVNHYYKMRENAEKHIDQYRQETMMHRNDYRIVEDKGDSLLLRNDSWTECALQLTECYFED